MRNSANASRSPLLRSALAVGLTLFAHLFAAPRAPAQEPFGEVRRLDGRSAEPYSNTADGEQVAASQEVRHAGAFFIKLHFSLAAIGPSDYITVSDPAGRQVRHYGALDIANISDEDGFWALSVFGEAARVELHAAPGSTGGGFEIDSYGYADPGILSICGAKDLVDMICLNDGLPDPPDDPNRYDLGRSVAAWLVVKPPGSPCATCGAMPYSN